MHVAAVGPGQGAVHAVVEADGGARGALEGEGPAVGRARAVARGGLAPGGLSRHAGGKRVRAVAGDGAVVGRRQKARRQHDREAGRGYQKPVASGLQRLVQAGHRAGMGDRPAVGVVEPGDRRLALRQHLEAVAAGACHHERERDAGSGRQVGVDAPAGGERRAGQEGVRASP